LNERRRKMNPIYTVEPCKHKVLVMVSSA